MLLNNMQLQIARKSANKQIDMTNYVERRRIGKKMKSRFNAQ